MTTIQHIIGAVEPKEVEQRRRSIVIDYLLATSTHGLRSVGRAYSTFNRVFWIAVFTIAFGFMFYLVVSSVLQYYAYPTQTNVEIRLDRTMPFPAVTICSSNPNRYDTMNASLVSYFYRLFPPNATFDQNTLNSLAVPLYIDLINRNQTQEFWSIGFNLSDILLQCTYNGINCSNTFIPSITSVLGNCFTFNWETSTKLFTIGDFGDTFVIQEGLSMTFYIPRELYFPNSWYDDGLTILLHNNDELPMPNENGLRLQPGLSHLITYRQSETTFLPSPYTTCTSDVGIDMRALYETTFLNHSAATAVSYSESLCEKMCEQSYIFSKCACVLSVPFLARSVLTLDGRLAPANFCNVLDTEVQCSLDAKKEFTTSEELQTIWCSHCTPQCKHTDFVSYLSAQAAPSEGEKIYWKQVLSSLNYSTKILLPSDFAERFDYYFDRNFLKVLVACGSKYVTEYRQEAKLSVIDTFSAIGGQTGLWIGLSVLSVIELGELAYRIVRHHFEEWMSRRRARVVPFS